MFPFFTYALETLRVSEDFLNFPHYLKKISDVIIIGYLKHPGSDVTKITYKIKKTWRHFEFFVFCCCCFKISALNLAS